MRFLYATDLHGNQRKYDDVYQYAYDNGIDLIHIGADILPKGPEILKEQKAFIRNYLKEFYLKCSESGIKVLAFFGNDDIYTRKRYLLEYASLLDETPVGSFKIRHLWARSRAQKPAGSTRRVSR